MPRLSELLSEEDRAKVSSWADRAKQSDYEREIPPELFQMALHGFYFGFGAIEAILRGYIDSVDQRTGKPIRVPYDLETVVALNQAARKVNYRHFVDMADLNAAAGISSRDRAWAESAIKRTNEIRKGKL